MSVDTRPLVSILTPVYNGEVYLRQCVDSVCAQTYSNWEYTIVNNCSADRTAAIAEEYAAKDRRIRVHNATEFVDIISNHNRAFKLMSPESKYCKVVSADDFIFPDCVERMVECAEANPLVGLVGSYQLSGGGNRWYIRNHGLPYDSKVVSGRDICRAQLLTDMSVFGTPTSTMYRADLVRSSEAFYPNATAEADVSGCFQCLQSSDFGFLHQILSYERLHQVRVTTTSEERNAYVPSMIGDLIVYGPVYLTRTELDERLKTLMKEYYEFLAISAVNFRDSKFWAYHKNRMKELGQPLSAMRLSGAIAMKVLDLGLNPKQTVEKILRRMSKG